MAIIEFHEPPSEIYQVPHVAPAGAPASAATTNPPGPPPCKAFGKGNARPGSDGWSSGSTSSSYKYPFRINQDGDPRTEWRLTVTGNLFASCKLWATRGEEHFPAPIPPPPGTAPRPQSPRLLHGSASAKIYAIIEVIEQPTLAVIVSSFYLSPSRERVYTTAREALAYRQPLITVAPVSGNGLVKLDPTYEVRITIGFEVNVVTHTPNDPNANPQTFAADAFASLEFQQDNRGYVQAKLTLV